MVSTQIYGIAPISVILRVKLLDGTSTSGAGLVGVTSASSGLKISTIQTNEATATVYTAGSTIETITTLGTYAAPTAGKCRFREVDATNLPGIYEIQIADARFANGTNPLALIISIFGVTNLQQTEYMVQCKNLYVDVKAVNGDTTAASNQALQYNGTGILGSSYPARQDQVTVITATGAATNQAASLWTNLSTPVTTTETGGYANTAARDASYDVLTNASQAQDSYYTFDVGGNGVPTGVSIYAAVQNAGKIVTVYGYNWSTLAWVQIGTMNTGVNALTLVQYTMAMYTSMVGTGANLGKVRIRLLSSAAGTTLSVDQIYVSYATVSNSVGYLDGAVWIDTINGTSGTTLYVNGTADKPVNTYAQALTIANALSIKRFHLAPNSSIVLTQSHANWAFTGRGIIGVNGQDISDAVFREVQTISGNCVGQNAFFETCEIGAISIDSSTFFNTIFTSNVTTSASGTYQVINGIDGNPGIPNPTFICKPLASYGLRNWRGGVNIDSLTTGNFFCVDGAGKVIINATCSGGGDLRIRGQFDLTDNVAGGFATSAFYDGGRWNEDQSIANITGNLSGSVANVRGNVSGSVATVTSAVTVGTNNDKTNYTISAGTVTTVTSAVTVGTNLDKTNYTVSAGTITNITGNVSGSVASVTGNVGGSVVGNVSGSVASVTGNVGGSVVGNVSGSVNSVVSSITVGINLDKTNYSTSAGTISTVTNDVGITQIAADKVWGTTTRSLTDKIDFSISGGTLTTNLDKTNYSTSAGTITTVTGNVNGSVASVTGSVAGSVASVTGNVAGSVAGSVNSVVTPVTVGTNNDKTNYSTSAGTITTITNAVTVGTNLDKNGYALSGTKKVFDNLNDISTSQVNSEVASALVSYDSNGGVAKENSVLAIQNNTNFVATIPSIMLIPTLGFNAYKVQVLYYSTSGTLMNVDGNEMAVNVQTVTGRDDTDEIFKDAPCVSACSASPTWPTFRQLVKVATGTYEGYYRVSASGELAEQHIWQFNFKVNTVAISYTRTSTVYNDTPGVSTLADSTVNKTIIAESILLTAANKIKTNASNQVESSSVQGDVTGNVVGSVNSVVTPVTVGTNNDKTNYSTSAGTITTVTGNVNGNILGSVASIVSSVTVGNAVIVSAGTVNAIVDDVNITQAGADKVWNTTTRSLTDKINFGVSGGTITTNLDKSGYSVSAITCNITGSVGSVVSAVNINDNTANKDIIASSMKSQNVSGTSAITGSVYDDLIDAILQGGTGTNLVTIKTTDETGVAVSNVWIGIYNASSSLIRTAISDDNGWVSGNNSIILDSGTYTGRFSRNLYSYSLQTLSVSGDSLFIVSGTAFTPTSGAIGTQTLYGTAIHGDGITASACTIVAELESIGDAVNAYLITAKKISTTSNASGYYSLALVKGATFKISEVYAGKSYYMKSITISQDASKDISTY